MIFSRCRSVSLSACKTVCWSTVMGSGALPPVACADVVDLVLRRLCAQRGLSAICGAGGRVLYQSSRCVFKARCRPSPTLRW